MAHRNIWSLCLTAIVLAFGPDLVAATGQLDTTPVADAKASSSDGVNWLLTDGGTSINTQYLPQYSVDRRGLFEFDLDPIPTNAAITSAALGLEVTALTHGGPGDYPVLRICGYAGDGSLSPGDATEIDVLIGESDPVTAGGPISIELDEAFIESLLGQTSYLGLVAWGSADGHQVGFATTEGTVFGYDPPLLSISYRPPPGDANEDGCADGLDYNTWSGHYLECGHSSWSDGGWTVGNFNEDNCVDGLDYNVWSRRYLIDCAGAAAAIPEPATPALLGLAGLALVRRRK